MPRRLLILSCALFLSAPSMGERVEGLVHAASNAALWVDTGAGSEILFPARAATLAGLPALKAFRSGDGVRAECAGPGPVRYCDVLEPDPPLNLSGEWVMRFEELRRHLEGEGGKAKTALLDVRPLEEYRKGHLPGARHWAGEVGAALVVPPGNGMVLYGRSERDPAPHKVLRTLLADGRSGVRVFREGIEGWDAAGLALFITAEGLDLLAASEPVIIVDVRDKTEREHGTLPGAIALSAGNMHWKAFSSPLGMPSLLFYGADERDPRPGQAAEQVLRWRVNPGSGGDRPVCLLTGGLKAWKAAGRPLSPDPPGTEIILSDYLPAGAVSPDRFQPWLDHPPPDRVLVDLRKRGTGEIPGTLHIPMEELLKRLSELPRDKTLTLFCAAGKQVVVAREMLRLLGYRAEYLFGPFPGR